MKRTVTVLQDDIDNGVRHSSSQCAVARAVCRDLADLVEDAGFEEPYAIVNTGVITVGGSSGNRFRTLHGGIPVIEVCDFIMDFDSHRAVQPFKFEIDLKKWESA